MARVASLGGGGEGAADGAGPGDGNGAERLSLGVAADPEGGAAGWVAASAEGGSAP